MSSEYEPLFDPAPIGTDDLEPVRDHFRAASRPFLRSPWSWFSWAVLLPAAALATPLALRLGGPAGVLFTWSGVILLGGAVEILAIRRAGRRTAASTLAAWVLRLQGNLSLIAPHLRRPLPARRSRRALARRLAAPRLRAGDGGRQCVDGDWGVASYSTGYVADPLIQSVSDRPRTMTSNGSPSIRVVTRPPSQRRVVWPKVSGSPSRLRAAMPVQAMPRV